ncbi:MAG TPA: sigma-70 family RNA polymerase sigma factor [Puia sp.]|jgi:RNA polymerase sigma-70 factor (TIGR02943 family)|nr:sigma-70 family RNA polymerase sigma factor [Puia sp.]
MTDQIKDNVSHWVELHTEKLLSWAYFKVADKELAEDLVQDTFLAAIQSFDRFQGNSEPKTWLLSILNNKIIDHYRKQSRNMTVSFNIKEDAFFNEDGEWREEAVPQPWDIGSSNLLDDHEFVKTLRSCMNRLPATWSSAMQLKYLQQKAGKEICQDLGITASNFWQILCRAKLQVRACIEKSWFKK